MMKRTHFDAVVETLDLIKRGVLDASPICTQIEVAELMAIMNGCGAAGAKFDFVPDTIYGLWVGPVCNIHDVDYHFETTIEDKMMTDRRMLNNNLRLIELRSNRIMKHPRRRRALTYWSAVNDFGGPAFWAGKNHYDKQSRG